MATRLFAVYAVILGTIAGFTSPARAVAKYCDECVCLSVCLSDRISPEPHARAIFTKFLFMSAL